MNTYKRRGSLTKKMILKRGGIIIIAVSLFVILLMGRTMFTSMAEEDKTLTSPYYKSIQIQEGDSLWKIASQYKEGSSMSTLEYIDQLKQMNCLTKDTIHTGQYLTVVYFE